MLLLPGCSAHSQPKRLSLAKDIQTKCPKVVAVDALYIHLIKCTSTTSEGELRNASSSPRRTLDRLLDYGDELKLSDTTRRFQERRDVVFVLPRPGTISPWSSKATDIAGLCNLSPHIERLERGVAYVFTIHDDTLTEADVASFAHLIHDRMTQVAQITVPDEEIIFSRHLPRSLRTIDITEADNAKEELLTANKELGLALSPVEIDYLVDAFVSGPSPIRRNPTDAELFMFAQVNSEHCRHKIFNASWLIDDTPRDSSLFQMIRNTERISNTGTISAYSDNAAVFQGHQAPRFGISPAPHNPLNPRLYQSRVEDMPILIKVETHNHPTAVSPYPGAATGSGGEIRDEGAVGRGSKPKAGLSGFTVSNLLIPGFEQPWEKDFGRPSHIASALNIMIEGPLGASAFNNEFGRPALTGYFRTYSESVPVAADGSKRELRGYHKPIMIAGGYGNVRPQFAKKSRISPGAKIVVLGGPGLLIGLGGGAASSQVSGASSVDLDFASVQRDNAEMQRRCQQVIDTCVDLGQDSPIQSIHDVGAGGLSNAIPELVHDSDLGALIEIRDLAVADSSMSPMEIWCNESQERYVLAISSDKTEEFARISARERCPFSIVGVSTENEELVVTDRLLSQDVIRLKMSTLFGKPPLMSRRDITRRLSCNPFDTTLSLYTPSTTSTLSDRLHLVVLRVLHLPSVGSKSFLITIGDRSITGLVTRDQMVGPWQVPVADVAVTRSSYGFDVQHGEAMAMGERTPVALLNPAASARMAVVESLTNLVAASIGNLSRVKLSANWMCAASKEGEGAGLYEAVKAIGMELCPALGVGIPVGKDSMSMSMKWREGGENREVSSPLSLIVTAFGAVEDVGATWTPQLRSDLGETTILVFFDLAGGKERLGGSALAQVFNETGSECPDVEDPALIKSFFTGCQDIRKQHPGLVLAYHDRSDGGLFTTLVEMCFAGHVGADISLDGIKDPVSTLFNEELGAVMQVRESQLGLLADLFAKRGFPQSGIHAIGKVNDSREGKMVIKLDSKPIFTSTRHEFQQAWVETLYRMQSLGDNATAIKEEYHLISDSRHDGLFYALAFQYQPSQSFTDHPKVAILHEQGVNSHVETACAFTDAGFNAVDILLRRDNVRAWGVQRMSVPELPEGDHTRGAGLAKLKPNRSERFETRISMVEIVDGGITCSSVFLRDMAGSKLSVAVAHGLGSAAFASSEQRQLIESQGLIGLR